MVGVQVLQQMGLVQENFGGLRYSISRVLWEAARTMQVCRHDTNFSSNPGSSGI